MNIWMNIEQNQWYDEEHECIKSTGLESQMAILISNTNDKLIHAY
jgi:hypothetical protein